MCMKLLVGGGDCAEAMVLDDRAILCEAHIPKSSRNSI